MSKFFKDPFAISLAVLILLLGIFAYLKFELKEIKLIKTQSARNLSGADKIEIESDQTVRIVKKNGNWIIESEDKIKADSQKIDDLLEALNKLEKKELVSQNKKHFENFGLDKKQAVKVKIFANDNQIFEIWVGDPGPSFNKTYFKIANEEKVYLSNLSLRGKIIRDSWAEPTPTPETENSSAEPAH
jgi:hypothetical protein